MKLYLSSYRIPTPNDLIRLLGQIPNETKVAIIPNAQDYYVGRARNIKINDVSLYLKSLRFNQIETVDLRNHNDMNTLKNTLQSYELIWVMGGNTFCLSYEMQRSGFSQIIKEVLESGVVYGGESAGAIMAGNSLKGIEFADPPEFAEEIVWETLNLTPHFIIPHADNQNFQEAIQKTRDLHKSNQTLIELKDNQSLVIDNSHNKITTQKS